MRPAPILGIHDALLLLAAVGLNACADTSTPPCVPMGVYAEFLSPAELSPQLDALAAAGTDLTLALPDVRIGDAATAALLRDAEAAGVHVRLWLVLDRSEGYWPNETNLARFDEAVAQLLAWLDAESLAADAIVFDLEPAFDYSETLQATLATTDLDAIQTLMRGHLDPVAFAASVAAMEAIVGRVHAAGLRAVCITYPQVLDDRGDGDRDLEDALDIPVSDVSWDEVGFMVYETAFATAGSGAWPGPGLVRSYAIDARAEFGDRASIALGLVGRAGIFPVEGPVYEEPSVLGTDVAAALAEGIERVEVYSLDGMLGLGGPAAWLPAARCVAPASGGRESSAARLARSLVRVLDTALDTP